MASASSFRTSLRLHNVIYMCAKFSPTKVSANRSVKAAVLSRVTSCIQIRAQFRPFQAKAMFKQHLNLMIWTWILRLQTASCNKFPCKNNELFLLVWCNKLGISRVVRIYFSKNIVFFVWRSSLPLQTVQSEIWFRRRQGLWNLKITAVWWPSWISDQHNYSHSESPWCSLWQDSVQSDIYNTKQCRPWLNSMLYATSYW